MRIVAALVISIAAWIAVTACKARERESTGASPSAPPATDRTPAPAGEVEAYAFAHWGGVFYVFTTVDNTNMVHAIHRKIGAYELVLPRTPYEVVGAGVSTCAPELEREPPQ